MNLLLSANSPRGSKPDKRILAAFAEWWKVHRSRKNQKEPSRRELANRYLGPFKTEKERKAAVENLKKMIQYYCRRERESDLLGDRIAQLLEF